MRKIFPDSVVENSSIQIINKLNRNYNLIYITILLTVVVALVSIFFIRTQVVVTATGVIKAEGDGDFITSPISGRLSIVKLHENISVEKGDTLFVIRPDNIMAQLPALNQRKHELTMFINDLGQITEKKSRNEMRLSSSIYLQEYSSYLSQLKDYEYNVSVTEKNFIREKKL
jgi:HlyD family secretion protein